MFARFNVRLDEWDDEKLYFYEVGKNLFNKQKSVVRRDLSKYIKEDGIIQVNEIEKEWFPSIKADIFFSHSHKDEKLVIQFAGWLYEQFKIISFIDSCVWGYANELLEIIDNKYCISHQDSEDEVVRYDYDMRNLSTSHVYMILNGALIKMMDKTECIMFINTPSSISSQDIASPKHTASPWIYSELLYSKLIGTRKLSEYRNFYQEYESKESSNNLVFNYNVETGS